MQHKVSRAKHTSWCSSMVLTSDLAKGDRWEIDRMGMAPGPIYFTP